MNKTEKTLTVTILLGVGLTSCNTPSHEEMVQAKLEQIPAPTPISETSETLLDDRQFSIIGYNLVENPDVPGAFGDGSELVLQDQFGGIRTITIGYNPDRTVGAIFPPSSRDIAQMGEITPFLFRVNKPVRTYVSDFANLPGGQYAYGTNIPEGSYVVAISAPGLSRPFNKQLKYPSLAVEVPGYLSYLQKGNEYSVMTEHGTYILSGGLVWGIFIPNENGDLQFVGFTEEDIAGVSPEEIEMIEKYSEQKHLKP